MASLRKNFSWILSGAVVQSICNFGILTAFAKTSTPESLGFFAYGLAVSNPVFSFLSLNLRGLQAADATSSYSLPSLIGSRYITNTVALAVMFCLALATSGPLELRATIALVAIGKSFDASISLLLGFYQRRQMMSMISIAQASNGALSLVFASILLVWSKGNPVFGATGYALGSLASARILWRLARRRERKQDPKISFRPTFRKDQVLEIFRAGLPLGAAISITAANAMILRHAIGSGLDMYSLGIFSALAYSLIPISMTTNALGQAALPRLADTFRLRPSRFPRHSLLLILAAAGVGGLLFLISLGAGRELLLIAYGPEYAAFSRLLTSLTLAGIAGSVSSIMTYVLLSAGARRVQLAQSIAGLASTALLSALLLPGLGLNGAPVVLGISNVAQATVAIFAFIKIRQAIATSGGSRANMEAAE